VDARRSQGQTDGLVFGYLGVKIIGADVWAIGPGTATRRLGPLAGANAEVIEPRLSWIGALMSSLLGGLWPKNARLCVAFADGTRYERLALPWVYNDWAKIAGEIGRFNAAAYLTPPL